jgi:hypothetical protein
MTMTTATVIPFPSGLPESDRKALEAIDRFIANPPDNSRVFWITPAMATYLHEKYNIDNRPEKPKKIGQYARDISAGEWRLTGDTIKFSNRSLLRDGQNRLLAGIASGKPFQTHIVFGIEDDFFSAMDQGKNRDGSDLLAIAGVANSAIVAAAVRWTHLYETDSVKLRTTIAPPEVLHLYQTQYSDITAIVPMARAIYHHHKWPAGFIAGSLYHLAKIDSHMASEFGKAMANSSFSGRYLPLAKMAATLAGVAAVSSGRVNDVNRAALLIIAWNLVRQNKKGKQVDFMWDASKPFPVAI